MSWLFACQRRAAAHSAPPCGCPPICCPQIYADVGAFDEEDGQTGLAHLLEHMAFKGTPRIGSRDYRSDGSRAGWQEGGCCLLEHPSHRQPPSPRV